MTQRFLGGSHAQWMHVELDVKQSQVRQEFGHV